MVFYDGVRVVSLDRKSGELLWRSDAIEKAAPMTGEIKREFPPDVKTFWFHQRCYRSKATDNFILPSKTGIEFVDIENEHLIPQHWVRGGCVYGIMPSNGMIYTPPLSCACYMESLLHGFCALAPESGSMNGLR